MSFAVVQLLVAGAVFGVQTPLGIGSEPAVMAPPTHRACSRTSFAHTMLAVLPQIVFGDLSLLTPLEPSVVCCRLGRGSRCASVGCLPHLLGTTLVGMRPCCRLCNGVSTNVIFHQRMPL